MLNRTVGIKHTVVEGVLLLKRGPLWSGFTVYMNLVFFFYFGTFIETTCTIYIPHGESSFTLMKPAGHVPEDRKSYVELMSINMCT